VTTSVSRNKAGKRAYPGGGELNGERYAVESATDLAYRRAVFADLEARIQATRPLDEELCGRCLLAHDVERRNRPHVLARNRQGLATRRDDLDVRARGEKRPGERARRADHVLAVVQHHQQASAPERIRERLLDRLSALLGHTEHARRRVPDRVRIGDRGQVDEPRTVRELRRGPPRALDRQAGLAHPARAEERHQTHPV
jgi:hypothetical protein